MGKGRLSQEHIEHGDFYRERRMQGSTPYVCWLICLLFRREDIGKRRSMIFEIVKRIGGRSVDVLLFDLSQ
jgi:hypothetical protein